MLSPVFLTVPGLHGSDPLHWQSIAEREIPNCKRVSGIDFEQPVIATWADALRTEIRASKGNVVLIGHGFGCLASVMAIADNDTHVAGVILVAPALPQRFNVQGLVHSQPSTQQSLVPSLLACLPAQSLGVPGLVVASSNDPWMRLIHSQFWADSWGLRLMTLRNAGHINTESGFGRWQGLHQIAHSIAELVCYAPLGDIAASSGPMRTRFSTLSKVRLLTRSALEV